MAAKTIKNVNGERRADIENWLDDKALTWEYDPVFTLVNIDLDRSLHNQARLGDPADPAVVAEYREAMSRGDKFPAIVVVRASEKTQAVNLDGNHRTEAALAAELDTFGAYVVTGRPATNAMTALTMEANTRHGRPTTTDERLQQAVWMIDSMRVPIERAAVAVNVSSSALRNRWDKTRADRRADEVGLHRSDWDSMSYSARTKLLTVSTDEGFKAAARLALAARLTVAEIENVVAVVNESRSATKQLAAVKSLRRGYYERIADVASGLVGPGSSNPRSRLRLALTNLLSLPEDFAAAITASLHTPQERTEAATSARAASARLTALADSLEA